MPKEIVLSMMVIVPKKNGRGWTDLRLLGGDGCLINMQA